MAEEVQPFPVEVTDQTEPDVIEVEPVSVVDTTAELLGRAKPRAPRARAGRTGIGATATTPRASRSTGARKSAAKKPAGRRTTTRSRKTAADKNDDDFGNR
jgi:hypothetical protein